MFQIWNVKSHLSHLNNVQSHKLFGTSRASPEKDISSLLNITVTGLTEPRSPGCKEC